MKNFKRLTAAIFTIGAIVYIATGMRYASYSPQRSDTYLWGVYHVHSSMSDGLLSPEGIALQAHTSGVSLVLLTDHGSPNPASFIFRETIDGVTIIGGSEVSLPAGHFTFFGARESIGFRLSSFPPEAMDNARQSGAFPVLAYPDDPRYGWRYWDSDLRPGGIELLNLFTSLRGESWADRFLLAMYYPFSRFYFLKRHCGSRPIPCTLGSLPATGQNLGLPGVRCSWRISYHPMAFDKTTILFGYLFVRRDGH